MLANQFSYLIYVLVDLLMVNARKQTCFLYQEHLLNESSVLSGHVMAFFHLPQFAGAIEFTFVVMDIRGQ